MMSKSETRADDDRSIEDGVKDGVNDGPRNAPGDDESRGAAEEPQGATGGATVGDDTTGDGEADYVPPDEDGYKMLMEKAAKADLYLNELLRVRADLDNYQKRVRRERPSWEATAVRGLLRDLLPVVDNFERALQSASEDSTEDSTIGDAEPDADAAVADPAGFADGVRMIRQMLHKVLDDHGVEEIEALHRPFDPEVHEAVFELPVPDRKTGDIIDVQQKGYVHREVVVRPSLVVVAKKVEPAAIEGSEGDSTAEDDSDGRGN